VAGAAVLAACEAGDARGQAPRPGPLAAALQLGYRPDPEDQDILKADYLPRFLAEHPGVKVDILTVSGNYEEAVQAAFAGGSAPDLLWVSHARFPNWASKGMLVKAEPLARRDGRRLRIDDFYPTILESARYQKELYGLPYLGGIQVVYFNRKLFREAGAPLPSDLAQQGAWTEGAFLESALKVRKASGAETAVFGTNATLNFTTTAMWLWGNGADFFTAERTAFATDTPAAQATLQFQADLAQKHRVAPRPGERLADGQAAGLGQLTQAMDVAWSTGSRNLLVRPDLDWDAAPVPKGTVRSLTMSGYNPLSLTTLSKQADAAWELIGHLTGPYVVKVWTERGRIMATRKSAAEQARFIDELPPAFRQLARVGAQASAPNPIVVANDDVARVVNPLMSAIASGERNVRDAALEMKRLADPLLKGA
jgi:multiple sugar transport system substrate-binding protein